MKLATCILAGGDKEHLILDAMRSVEAFTDQFILIWTGPSANAAVALAKEYCQNVTVVETDQDPYTKCSQGRNQCLRVAHDLGFDWACLLDTDMRIEADPKNVWSCLYGPDTVVAVQPVGIWNAKPMFWRLPACGVWRDDPHEWFDGLPAYIPVVPGATCWEAERSTGEWQARARSVLAQYSDGRELRTRDWWFKGEAHQQLGQLEEAHAAYLACAAKSSPEWSANCYWQIGSMFLDSDPLRTIEACTVGLKDLPACPELLWLAGVASDRLGLHGDAATFAIRAIECRDAPNSVWSYQPARTTGPWDILRWSGKHLGVDALAHYSEGRAG